MEEFLHRIDNLTANNYFYWILFNPRVHAEKVHFDLHSILTLSLFFGSILCVHYLCYITANYFYISFYSSHTKMKSSEYQTLKPLYEKLNEANLPRPLLLLRELYVYSIFRVIIFSMLYTMMETHGSDPIESFGYQTYVIHSHAIFNIGIILNFVAACYNIIFNGNIFNIYVQIYEYLERSRKELIEIERLEHMEKQRHAREN